MQNRKNENIYGAVLMMFGLFMLPFMLLGNLWGGTLNQMEVLSGEGWGWLYDWAIRMYGWWPRTDPVEQGFMVLRMLFALCLCAPVLFVAAVLGWHIGLGVYVYKHPLSITPWESVNLYVIPVVVGLIHLLVINFIFRKYEWASICFGVAAVGSLVFVSIVLPILLMMLTGLHMLVH